MPSPKHADSSSVDRLSALFERFRVRARMFHNGPLCGVTRFADTPGLGFMHVMRRGTMSITHRARSGAPQRVSVREPSLIFYPRPLAHDFHNAPTDGADFSCATLAFDGGAEHPIARALPPLVVLPLARVQGLEHTLALLFAETEQLRCGQRLLADRLFEVLLLQLLRWLLDHADDAPPPIGLLAGLAHPRLARTLVALHERPGEAWTLQRMAQAAGLSRSTFAATFKATVGEPPSEYLARWRIALAQSELQRGTPVKRLAAELGYANASALSRVFAQKVGASPRAWKAAAAS
jgi:AraC-like DNA-binding protein